MENKSFNLSCLIMVKNEENTIINTLISVQNYIEYLIIYDTGSDDNTVQIITEFCENNNIILKLKQEKFINFEESRNKALQFAESIENIDYLLLLDSNDILENGKELLKLCEEKQEVNETGFYLSQEWYNNGRLLNTFLNIRLIKPNKGWKYKGFVHEYIYNETESPVKNNYNIILKQDRLLDNSKSFLRFLTDKEVLKKSLEFEPNNSRNIFYLAQTHFCLNEYDESFKNYLLRTTLKDGFNEEIFHSFIRCGDIIGIQNGNWSEAMVFYMKAYEIEQRIEPLIKIAQYYIGKEQWNIAFSFLSIACKLPYPTESLLFVDKYMYDYGRWHLMGALAFYCGEQYKNQGKNACIKAIEAENRDIDKINLIMYD